jgi:hypothetical protein
VQPGPRTHEAATGVVVISDATRDPSPADAPEPAIRFAARGQPTADRSDDHLVLEATTPGGREDHSAHPSGRCRRREVKADANRLLLHPAGSSRFKRRGSGLSECRIFVDSEERRASSETSGLAYLLAASVRTQRGFGEERGSTRRGVSLCFRSG